MIQTDDNGTIFIDLTHQLIQNLYKGCVVESRHKPVQGGYGYAIGIFGFGRTPNTLLAGLAPCHPLFLFQCF